MKALAQLINLVFSATLICLVAPQKLSADTDRYGHPGPNKHKKTPYRGNDKHYMGTPRQHNKHSQVIHYGHRYVIPKKRIRHYRHRRIVRPYGHWYHGYGHYHHDHEAFKWLAFSVITLAILDDLNESQQRAHEAAQIRATTAPIGERIIWNDKNVSGTVTAIRDGTSTSGRYCREFQQDITINNRSEQAFGTACRQQDGAWEVISTRAR